MDSKRVERRLSAIMSADAVGYTRLMADDDAATLATLNAYRGVMGPLVERHRGRVVDAVGDNLLAEFSSVIEAVTCAVEIQRELAERNGSLSPERRMPFRIGINLGDVIHEGERIYGDGVNVAARVEGLAEPGGVCLSGSAFDQVEGKLDLTWDDLGEHTVKNLPKPVRVHRVKLGAVEAPPVGAGAPEEEGRPSIAVLPFISIASDKENEVFADGMTEDLITLLSYIPGFFVIARTSSFGYKGQSPDVRQVGRQLGVRYVVEGSVRKLGKRIRVTVQLIEAASGRHLWAEKYDRPLEEIFDLQDEVTGGIGAQLQPQLERAEVERARHLPPEKLDAWALYHRAWHSYLSTLTPESCDASLKLCEEALALYPEYAHAHSMRGTLLADRVIFGWSENEEADTREAFSEGRRALELAPDDAEVLHHWGNINAELGELQTGISALQRSLELNPNNAHVHAFLGIVIAFSGDISEGVRKMEHAFRLSPRDRYRYLWHSWLAMAYTLQNRFEEALGEIRRSLDLHDAFQMTWLELAHVLTKRGEHQQAREALERLHELDPEISADRLMTPYRRMLGPFEDAIAERLSLLREAGFR